MASVAPTPEPGGARHYLPLGLDLTGWECLVVGGGRVGARKAATLASAGARVTLVSPELGPAAAQAARNGAFRWRRARYAADHLDGIRLVVAATDNAALNLQIGQEASARGLLFCIASSGRSSSVIFPAIHRRDGLTVAVHSDGRRCARSRSLRDRIAQVLDARPAPPVPALFRAPAEEGAEAPCPHSAAPEAEYPPFLLVTCRRRETYALRENPAESSAEMPRPDQVGPAVFHHLVRVAVGLDSPLRGEADVAEQLREALVRQRRRLSPGLSGLVAAALRAQAAVRLASGLGADRSWAAAVVTRLELRLGGLRGCRVALLGCGRLNAAVADRLAAGGAEAIPFSHRAEIPWCASRGWRVLPWRRLREGARGVSAAVLGGRLTPAEADDLVFALPPSAPVLDLADVNAALRPRCAAYEGLESFADGPPIPSEAARLAAAERAAFAETLRWVAGAGPVAGLPPALRVGARRSALSMAQVAEMRGFLAALQPETAVEFVALDAPGDRDKATPLPAVTAEDFFTRDIDEAVRSGVVDAGLHSAKDLPRQFGEDLVVAAQTPSFAPWECLVTRGGGGLDTLPPGARIGTSSVRRAQRLRELRPDLVPTDIRGNVPDRIRRLDEGAYDGLILAAAGLLRLRLEGRIAQVFSPQEFPPEPAQGALALVVRRDRADLLEGLAPLDLGRARP